MKKRYIILGVGVLAVIVAGGLSMRNGGEEAPEVQTTPVEKAKIVQKVNATGKIQPKTQVKISADVSAKIIRLDVREGDWVEKGDFLLELDRERYLASVESEEANVRSIQANANLVNENVEQTEREFKRARELVERGLESQAALDRVEAAYQVEVARFQSANDQVEQAKGRLKQARDDLSKTTIYAPMAGTISDLNKEQGEIAIGSQFQEDVIMVLANLEAMEALVNVDENDIVAIELGQTSEIEVDALPDELLKGTVAEIANSANVSAQGTASQKTEFEVKITVDSPTDKLRPGMTASADIVTDTREEALSIPIQSVTVRTIEQLEEGDENAKDNFTAAEDGFVELVFVVEDGKAVARQVKTGIQSDELIEVVSGLAEGDQVVSGSYRAISRDLVHGKAVTVNNEADRAGQ
ncbi:efflux RND transporter periplasmic adaptor subunit [Pseudomonadota bacterium]